VALQTLLYEWAASLGTERNHAQFHAFRVSHL
jgi:hypothetical protein